MDEIMKMLGNIQGDILKQKQDMKEMEQNIKDSINRNIDDKFNRIEAKTKELECKIEQQQKTIEYLDKQLRKRNLVFFGVEEKEKSYEDLCFIILDIINNKMEINCTQWEIETVIRVGKKAGKLRPIVVTLTTTGRKIEILKKKKSLENTCMYIKEDYPVNVLQKRKELQETLKLEREAGNLVALRYDKIVTLKKQPEIHSKSTGKKTNKRLMSTSPETATTAANPSNIREGAKQVQKKNKIQTATISSFLRPSQLKPVTHGTMHETEEQQKN
ncbi:hypothetical protein PYW07_001313 [Mythimna separata]|uniref:Endonuclease-reverse transcriptase n=1 Tax=Mythimna separata TaxID=271217 RepID=A0AAD7YUC1_MYTSE|nr:hypothetical protein PYW07_001313 [Mythimna separata]